MGTVYCENRIGATQQTLFQDRVLWSPLRQIRAVVRAGLTIAWPFPWAIHGGSPSVRWEHSLTIVILFAYTGPFGRRAWMKPELSPVVLGLLIAGFSFAVVLALVRVHPAELEAPGLKFVSPGIARK